MIPHIRSQGLHTIDAAWVRGGYVVSRQYQGHQKLSRINMHASGVSRALWPANTWRCIPTSKTAQWRRSLIMGRTTEWSGLQHAVSEHRRALLTALAFLAGGVALAAVALHSASLLLVLFSLWILASLLTLRYAWLLRRLHTKQRRFARKKGLRSLPTLLHFPETPMPATPSVRVLETIDLSTTDVEHFIPLPRSQTFPTPPPHLRKDDSSVDIHAIRAIHADIHANE